jgi:alanyl-tRNA synthetase
MTLRLYYSDSSLRDFDAVVTRVVEHESRPAVILDRTAFYPSSGGQPFDTGRLGAGWLGTVPLDTVPVDIVRDTVRANAIRVDSVRVCDVVDVDGDVLHVLEGPPTAVDLSVGARVHGEIDWTRRLDHMQQHTGQHILSAAFDLLFDNRTQSFHMGADLSTIDLAREQPLADVERAVDQANRVVWEDRPVSIRFVSEEEAKGLPLRKESVRHGELRLIDVTDFDVSACGGTHVARTGSIGIIAVLHTERFKGGMRVAFGCGGRALRVLREQRDVVTGSIRVLSVLPRELPGAIDKLQAEAKALRTQVSGLQLSLAQQEAEQALATLAEQSLAAAPDEPSSEPPSLTPPSAEPSSAGGTRVVIKAYDGWDANGLKAIASALVAKGRVATALVSTATPALVVVARSATVAIDAAAVVRALTVQFGGRGGGKPDLAQAGGLGGSVDQIMAAARALLVG